jgi:hypothetical protein
MSSSIRPVSRRLAASKEIWDDTNLPFAVVVTPLHAYKNGSNHQQILPPLTSIPKCLHCGAPHPTKATHYRPLHHTILLCYLCGKTSSTKLQDQQDVRLEERLDRLTYDTLIAEQPCIELELPLFSNHPEQSSLPAIACPPIWWIVLDRSCTSRSYWSSVGAVLEDAFQDIPSHVHVGILSASSTTLSSWDLTTPIPHVRNASLTSPSTDHLCLVPADALHKSSIQAALRAITDMSVVDEPAGKGINVGATLELLLDYLDEATHPSSQQQQWPEETSSPLKYAGGKILVFLGNPPLEIPRTVPQPPFYKGGVGGSCGPPMDKWVGTDIPESEPTDMTPTNLRQEASMTQEPYMDPTNLYAQLGTKCGLAALGVDILVVADDAESYPTLPWFGIPLLRNLSEKSGAPGPILCSSDDIDRLQQQVSVRTPWHPSVVFGVQLRLRISPGFATDTTSAEPMGDDPSWQLGPLYTSSAIMGPASAVPGEPNLWCMGSCDPCTSLTLDMQVQNVKDRFYVDGFGEVALIPVIQTSVVYTCIQEDDEGHFVTVRKVRIATLPLPLAYEVEPIYDALDPEALAVVLFHKLSLSSLQDGLMESQDIGQSWLKSLLICLYHSAEIQQVLQKDRLDRRIEIENSSFVSAERLIDLGGHLDADDVLLGQGHRQVSILPFLVFALLQCDALRPTCGSFRPSMDARSAAMAQMASMTPSKLAKCIAPCLQLWSTQEDAPIMEMVELRQQAIQDALLDCGADGNVFYLDSPQQILIYDAHRVLDSSKVKQPISLGPKLQAVIQATKKSCRTPPVIRYELEEPKSKEAGDDADRCLDDVLIEDKPTATGFQDFAVWKEEVASMVHE